jgi:hypothetical protein
MFEGYNFNNAPNNYTDDDVVRDFVLAWTGGGDASHSWASPELDDLVRDEPERAWRIILALSEQSPDDQFESILAAGPIENLLSKHGPAFIERIEQHASTNQKFNHILGGVWKSDMINDVWNRVQAARKQVW